MTERSTQAMVVIAAAGAIVAAAASLLPLFDRSEGGNLDSNFAQAVQEAAGAGAAAELLPEIAKLGADLQKVVGGFLSVISDRVDDGRIRRRDIVAAFCEGRSTTQIVAKYGYERGRIENVIKTHARQNECARPN